MPDGLNIPDPRVIARAVQSEAIAIMTDVLAEAKRQVPTDKRTLSRSATKTVRKSGESIEIKVTFNTPYAARQHEERSYHHPRGGKAKYLEDPMRAMVPEAERRLAEAYRKALT